MNSGVPQAREQLSRQLDGLRQMALLAVGVNHPVYRDIDEAWRSGNTDRMREAIEAFDRLPDDERNYALGLDHTFDDLTGTD